MPGAICDRRFSQPSTPPSANDRRHRRRKRQDRRRENHRDDAAGIHLQRNVRARPAVHPPPDDALGVLHRHLAGVRARRTRSPPPPRTISTISSSIRNRPICPVRICSNVDMHRVREVDDDAGEDDERHAVADAALGDLLAEPHDERRAGRQREHRQQPEAPARAVDERQTAGDVRLLLEIVSQCPATARRSGESCRSACTA